MVFSRRASASPKISLRSENRPLLRRIGSGAKSPFAPERGFADKGVVVDGEGEEGGRTKGVDVVVGVGGGHDERSRGVDAEGGEWRMVCGGGGGTVGGTGGSSHGGVVTEGGTKWGGSTNDCG